MKRYYHQPYRYYHQLKRYYHQLKRYYHQLKRYYHQPYRYYLQLEKILSPTEKILSPTEKILSPTEKILSPTEKILSPTEKILSPTVQILSPTVQILSPTEKILSPTEKILSPTKDKILFSKEINYVDKNQTSDIITHNLAHDNVLSNSKVKQDFNVLNNFTRKLNIKYSEANYNISYLITGCSYDIYNFNNNIVKVTKIEDKKDLYEKINCFEDMPNSILYINDMYDKFNINKTCIIADYLTINRLLKIQYIKTILKPKLGIIGIIQIDNNYIYIIICTKSKKFISHLDLNGNNIIIPYDKIQYIITELKSGKSIFSNNKLSINYQSSITDFYMLCSNCFPYINIILLTNSSKIELAYLQNQDKFNLLTNLYIPNNIILWKIYKSKIPQILIFKNKNSTRSLPYSTVYPIRLLNKKYINLYKSNKYLFKDYKISKSNE